MRSLKSDRKLASTVGNVLDRKAGQGLGAAEAAGAGGLVADCQVELALLIDTPGAGRVLNVEEGVVLGHEALRLGKARRQVVHAVGSREGQPAAVLEEVLALAGGDGLPVHGNTTTLGGSIGGRFASAKVVPGIVGNVEGTARLVDAEQVDAAVAVGDFNADVVAADGVGPVGNAVNVNLATKDTDGRREGVVGRNAGGAGLAGIPDRNGGGRDQAGRSSKEGGQSDGEHID